MDAESLRGRSVLIVEDEYFLAIDLHFYFEEVGATVLGPVGSVEDALSVVEKVPELDAAVLDVNLRDAQVFAVADALEARGVPFVFTTGGDRRIVPHRHASVPVCQKPFDMDAVTGAVARLMQALPPADPRQARDVSAAPSARRST